jgi:hypothetical protein
LDFLLINSTIACWRDDRRRTTTSSDGPFSLPDLAHPVCECGAKPLFCVHALFVSSRREGGTRILSPLPPPFPAFSHCHQVMRATYRRGSLATPSSNQHLPISSKLRYQYGEIKALCASCGPWMVDGRGGGGGGYGKPPVASWIPTAALPESVGQPYHITRRAPMYNIAQARLATCRPFRRRRRNSLPDPTGSRLSLRAAPLLNGGPQDGAEATRLNPDGAGDSHTPSWL